LRSRIRWGGDVEAMPAGKLATIAERQHQQGHRRRGRSQLRWKDCGTRDRERPGDDMRWGEVAMDGVLWKQSTGKVIQLYFN